MTSKDVFSGLRDIDFQRLQQDFQNLDPNDPGVWPLAPRVAAFLFLFVATIAAAWWFDWSDQAALLEKRQAEEQQLRQDWLGKKRMAVNLDESPFLQNPGLVEAKSSSVNNRRVSEFILKIGIEGPSAESDQVAQGGTR